MVNEQLLGFIKNQLQLGIEKDKITSSLLSNGWTLEDVTDGFNALNIPTDNPPVSAEVPVNNNNNNNSKFLITTLIVILFLGGLSAYYFKDNIASLSILKYFTGNDNVEEVSNIVTNEEDTKAVDLDQSAQDLLTSTTDPLSCDNYQCLISAVPECRPVSVVVSYSDKPFQFFPGMLISGENKYALQKSSDLNKCSLVYSSANTFVSISEEGRKSALKNNITDTQITEQLKTINDSFKISAGMQTTCSGETTAILSYLEGNNADTQNGDSSTEITSNLNGNMSYTTPSGEKLTCIDTSPRQPINISTTITDKECNIKKGLTTTVTNVNTACFENQTDLGSIIGEIKIDGKYPQCCAYK
ncbi:MAG: hypothetical protein K9L98_02520 [Candidatus Pacebacteria bacterium]|nr:hypothetical protein [Candidatus Paceibacterota bacterium]MCF7862860.1 hypothetical protein [Candidatus Paceibacterota bacterium]